MNKQDLKNLENSDNEMDYEAEEEKGNDKNTVDENSIEAKFFGDNNKYVKLLENKKKAKGFRTFNLNDNIMEAIKRIGYKFPTPIQRKTIPDIMSGFNVIAHSRTGSGKTAAFLIPILNRLKEHSKMVGCRCLILSPTRELAHQTLANCKKLGKFANLRYTLLVGGNELEGQFEKLAQNPDIIIATPGRVMHHLNEGSLNLKKIEILCIDEADKIFELNFEEQVKIILRSCPMSRQVLLFSATIPQQLAQFMKTGIREYKLVNIDEENKIPDKLKIHLISTRTEEKKFALISLLTKNPLINPHTQSTLIFVATKYHCEFLHEFLKFWKIKTLFIYGQMDQELRDTNLEKFRKRAVNTLIVTDVAARGLDIPQLDNVINYDFPDTMKLFIHRVGRTARAGKEGKCFNIVAPMDFAFFFDFKVSLGKKLTLHRELDKVSKEDLNNDLNDFNTISYGNVPQAVINSIKESREDYLNFKTDIESLEDSVFKATGKASGFKQKPSKYGIKQAKKLLALQTIGPHPMYIKQLGSKTIKDEIEKVQFLTQLKNFKPKESYFERVNETNVKEEIIKDFKHKAEIFKKKKELEKKKDKFLREKSQMEGDDLIDEEDEVQGNTGEGENTYQNFLDKNLDKFNDDSDDEKQGKNKNKNEKNVKNGKNEKNVKNQKISKKSKNSTDKSDKENKLLGRKVKRSQIKNFRNNPHYITETKNSSDNLWGDEKPLSLDELTLNIAPDDDSLANRKKLVWDPKKKNFVRANVDRNGVMIKKNESGVKIKGKDKKPHAYQTWKKKNKLRVQNVGEMENDKISSNAENMFKERKFQKQQKHNQKQAEANNPGRKYKNEVKNFDQLLKGKKENFKKNSRKNFSMRDAKQRQIREKSHLNRKSMVLVKRRKK
jgi:ATP-dependent RNA helicase DDX54/DBP10